MILLHMATQQPQRVEAMIISSATIYFPEQCRERQRLANADGPNVNWERLRQIHKRGDEQIWALHDQFRRLADSYDDMNFTPPYLSTITARTLVVDGDRDPFFPVAIHVEMYHNIPHSYLWIVPNWGHSTPAKGPPFSRPDLSWATWIETALEFLRGEWDK
jgi:pimeloyl-ACP methyl ester carboxylesterase